MKKFVPKTLSDFDEPKSKVFSSLSLFWYGIQRVKTTRKVNKEKPSSIFCISFGILLKCDPGVHCIFSFSCIVFNHSKFQ